MLCMSPYSGSVAIHMPPPSPGSRAYHLGPGCLKKPIGDRAVIDLATPDAELVHVPQHFDWIVVLNSGRQFIVRTYDEADECNCNSFKHKSAIHRKLEPYMRHDTELCMHDKIRQVILIDTDVVEMLSSWPV